MVEPQNIGEPKLVTPHGASSGVLVEKRLFGKKETRDRAARLILHAIDGVEFDTTTELGAKGLREADELRYHALCILGEDIPEDLKATAKASKWRPDRADATYVLGATTRYRAALGLAPEKFVAPKNPKDGVYGFWEWHAAINQALVSAEADVKAGKAPKNVSSKILGWTVSAPDKKTPAVTQHPTATITLQTGNRTPGSTITGTPPIEELGEKRKADRITPSGRDVTKLSDAETTAILKVMEVMGGSFFEAMEVVVGPSKSAKSPMLTGSPKATPVGTPASSPPAGPPALPRSTGRRVRAPFWGLGSGN